MAINNTVLLFGYELVKLSIYLTLKKNNITEIKIDQSKHLLVNIFGRKNFWKI